jgi:hypothetical protein
MKCISRKPLGLFHRIGKLPKKWRKKNAEESKRLALLCLLLVTSASFAVAVQATGLMKA